MKQAQLIKLDNLILGINQFLPFAEDKEIELYFFLPKEMRIGPETLAEEQVFYRAIRGKRFYSSSGHHLYDIEKQFIKLKRRIGEDYRRYLNLMVYQISTAVENDVAYLRRDIEMQDEELKGVQLCDLIKNLLAQFRSLKPEDEKRYSYFSQADNYLSWYCEQQLLKLLSQKSFDENLHEIRMAILKLCRAENHYRVNQNYNTKKTLKNPNRIANKMVLLQRVVQQGVVLKEDLKNLGIGLQRLTTGMSMALVMLFITVLVLQAQNVFSNLTIAFVISMAFIYGLREIFKDDVKNVLWRRVRKGRPKWRRQLIDTTSKQVMADERIWLEYLSSKDIPEIVSSILKVRQRQNRLESQILFYRLQSRVTADHFPDGYQEIKEQVQFSLVPFTQYLHKGKAKVYSELDGEVEEQTVERRYQINLIMTESYSGTRKVYRRFKITLNCQNIVEVTEADLGLHE